MEASAAVLVDCAACGRVHEVYGEKWGCPDCGPICPSCARKLEGGSNRCAACGELAGAAYAEGPVRYLAIEGLAKCPKCGAPVPLNGPYEQLRCGECQTVSAFSWEHVDKLDRWRPQHEARRFLNLMDGRAVIMAMDKVSVGSAELDSRIGLPACADCGASLPPEALACGPARTVPCAGCASQVSLYPAPSWVRQHSATAVQVYSAERADAQAAVSAPKPILFQCPSCGAKLPVTSDSQRSVVCSFCNSQVFLPEALWKMLHPAKTAKRWFLRLEGMSAERQAERAQSARKREAQQRDRAAESAAREARRDEQLAAEQVKAQAASRSKLVYGIGLAALVAAVVAALLLYR